MTRIRGPTFVGFNLKDTLNLGNIIQQNGGGAMPHGRLSELTGCDIGDKVGSAAP